MALKSQNVYFQMNNHLKNDRNTSEAMGFFFGEDKQITIKNVDGANSNLSSGSM